MCQAEICASIGDIYINYINTDWMGGKEMAREKKSNSDSNVELYGTQSNAKTKEKTSTKT